MLDDLRSQREAGKFCDIVLCVGGKRFPAHRAVLAASSPFFESLLRNNKSTIEDKGEILIGWDDSESFEALLDYIYSGDIRIDENNVVPLSKLSENFLITKLQEFCNQYLEEIDLRDNKNIDDETMAEESDSIVVKEEFKPEKTKSSSGSSRKRKVKSKYNSEEWETADLPTPRKAKCEEVSEIRQAEESIRANQEMHDDEMIDLDESSMDQRPAGQTASLAQWREGIKCPHCSYIGHSATRLEQHLSRVHEEDTTYKCRLCEFTCKWNREYYRHMKCHFDGPPYKCEDCDYTCDRIQFILSHRMRHTDERPFNCEMCPFKSRTKGNLIVHMRIHTGEKPYKCQYCNRGFAMKNTLDQHLATHREDRPFLCDTCGFTTKYQSHLLSHRRIHSGNVFHCTHENCNYFSPRRSQLAAHERSHSSIRSHICITCGQGFIERSHLVRHERIHLEDKPFKCDKCDYESTRRDKLKEHVLKHHSDDSKSPAPYKPRKARRQSTVPIVEESTIPEISNDQLIVTSSSAEIEIAPTEQEVATANLIYEYTTDNPPTIKTLVIQNIEGGEGLIQLKATIKSDNN